MTSNSDDNHDQDDRVVLSLEVPEESKSLLENQDGFMWEALTEAIHSTYGGERLNSPAALDREIERMKRKKRNAYERIQEAEEEYHRLEQRLESLEQRREEQIEQAASKEESLDNTLQNMAQRGHNVYLGHGTLSSLADQWFSGDEHAALEALKERNESGKYNLPESRFEQPGSSGPSASSLKSLGGDDDE